MASWIRTALALLTGLFSSQQNEMQIASAHHQQHTAEQKMAEPHQKETALSVDITFEKQEIGAVQHGKSTDVELENQASALLALLEKKAKEEGHTSQKIAALEAMMKDLHKWAESDIAQRDLLIQKLKQEIEADKLEKALLAESVKSQNPEIRKNDEVAVAQEEKAEEKLENDEKVLEAKLVSEGL